MRSPTTTRPVAIPTRAASGCPAASSPATVRDQREAGPNRTLGVVLVGLRPAEIGKQPVAKKARDVALEAGDGSRGDVLIGADYFAHVLGIEPRGQRGRAGQITEQHGQLPPLGLGSRASRSRWSAFRQPR